MSCYRCNLDDENEELRNKVDELEEELKEKYTIIEYLTKKLVILDS